MKNILFIIYTFSLGGGAERILANIVNNLNPKKYNIDILEYAEYGVKEEEVRQGVNKLPAIVSMKNTNKILRLAANIQVFTCAYFLKKGRKKYDLEISFNYQIPTFLLSKNVPKIAWMHGDVYCLREQKYFRWKQRRAFRNIDSIVAISENTEASLVELFPETAKKIVRIYNGFEINKIRNSALVECTEEINGPSLLYVGRLEEGKNPLVLLDVVNGLKKKNVIVFLYYIGLGELQEALERKIQIYGLEEQVFVYGYRQNPYPIMKKADILCMMSNSEGFPTVFAEGMALGKPFISTPVGGAGELANSGKCGILVESVEECMGAIEQVLLEEVYQKMSEECKLHIKNYSIEKQIQQIEGLIDKIL